jgi:hypothetical protein
MKFYPLPFQRVKVMLLITRVITFYPISYLLRKIQVQGALYVSCIVLVPYRTWQLGCCTAWLAGSEFTIGRQSLSSGIFIKTMCLRSYMKLQVIVLSKDQQFALPIHAEVSHDVYWQTLLYQLMQRCRWQKFNRKIGLRKSLMAAWLACSKYNLTIWLLRMNQTYLACSVAQILSNIQVE